MLGLVLAALYVAYCVAQSTTAEAAIASTMPFLWYWHLVFVCIFGVIVLIVFLVGLGMTVFGDSGGTKGAGLVVSFLGAPLMIVLGAIGAGLFLGGVYCMNAAIAVCPDTGAVQSFDAWNMQLFITGAVLYGIGVIRQLFARLNLGSSSKD